MRSEVAAAVACERLHAECFRGSCRYLRGDGEPLADHTARVNSKDNLEGDCYEGRLLRGKTASRLENST